MTTSAICVELTRREILAHLRVEDGFIAHSVNVRFADGVALGLPGVTICDLALEWAEVLRDSFPDAGVGVIQYGRMEEDRAKADQLTAAVKQWVIDARKTGRCADRETLRALGYWLSWEPEANSA